MKKNKKKKQYYSTLLAIPILVAVEEGKNKGSISSICFSYKIPLLI